MHKTNGNGEVIILTLKTITRYNTQNKSKKEVMSRK